MPLTRLDSYDVASMESALIVTQVTRPDGILRMPPPPSARLTDYEIEVLRRWDQQGAPRGGAPAVVDAAIPSDGAADQ